VGAALLEPSREGVLREFISANERERGLSRLCLSLVERQSQMLSVGRELNIRNKCVVCCTCLWEGAGAELSAGLVQVTCSPIYFYVYRCPECASYELVRKGKLLQFRFHATVVQEAEEAGPPKSEHAMP
jgi:hypothetical protein